MVARSFEASLSAVRPPGRLQVVLSAGDGQCWTIIGQRVAGVEGTMSRYKRIIGDTLRSHGRPWQEVETRIAVNVLNRMLDLGRPGSVRAA
jgi:hypothetical protein